MTNTNDILTWLKTVRGSYAGKAIDLIEQQEKEIENLKQQVKQEAEFKNAHYEHRITELEAEVERLKDEFPSPRWDWAGNDTGILR